MRKLSFALFAVLFCSLSMAAPPEVKASSQPGGTYKIDKGALLTVMLDGNPSTGFSWNLDSKLAILKLVSAKTEESKANKELTGAPVKINFTFKALKSGTEKIALRYFRVWEKKSDKDKTWTATVIVKGAPKPNKPAKK